MSDSILTLQPPTTALLERFHFEVVDSFWLIGMGSSGPYFDRHTPSANWVIPIWKEFLERQDEVPAEADRSRFLSPCHGRETDFTFYCGFAVAEKPSQIPPGMKAIRILAHTYAVGTVSGPYGEIDRVYGTLPEWAAAEGHPINKAILWLEIYPNGPTFQPDLHHYFQVYLPIA